MNQTTIMIAIWKKIVKIYHMSKHFCTLCIQLLLEFRFFVVFDVKTVIFISFITSSWAATLVSSHNAAAISESASKDATWCISSKHCIDSCSSTAPCKHGTTFSRTWKQNWATVHCTNCRENTSSRSVCSIISMLAGIDRPKLLKHQQTSDSTIMWTMIKSDEPNKNDTE